MKITKEILEELRKDKELQLLVDDVFGLNLNDILDNIEIELENQKTIKDRSIDIINKAREEENENKVNTENTKEKYTTPKVENTFLMNYEQFRKFIHDYSELINALKKMEYWYGISFKDNATGFSLIGKVNEIIWDLIGIIFGKDNREDIADYLYGNSNFDSPKSLYEELV